MSDKTTTQSATIEEVLQAMNWSEARRVETGSGPRMLRKADPNERFSAAWKENKSILKDAGLSWSKDPRTGAWQVCWWTPLDEGDRKREEERQAASRATDAAIEIPCPEGLAFLGYQKGGVAFALKAFEAGKAGALIGDEMGLGKTIQAIGVINAIPEIKRVLVVCPAALKINWKRELAKWLSRPMTIGVQAAGEEFVRTEIVILNYDIVTKYDLGLIDWDLIIIDEAQYCKNPKARRTKATLGIKAKRMLALTGTPILNRPVELFPVINRLDPVEWKNFFGFAKRYCGAIHNGYGWDFKGATNLEELQRRLRASIMVRRLKDDVLTELPPKRRQVIELPGNGASALVKREWETHRRIEAELEDLRAAVQRAVLTGDLDGYDQATKALKAGETARFAECAKIAHEIALAKVPYVAAHVTDAIEDGDKVILFAHHHDVIDAYMDEFGNAAVSLTGEDDAEKRQAAVDRFQSDPSCKVFVGSIRAAGVGLTLTAAAHVVFGEIDWTPGVMSQAEDRAHRIGQANSVLVQIMVLEESLDAHKVRVLINKMRVIDRALDAEQAEEEEESSPKSIDRSVVLTWEEAKAVEELTPEQIEKIHLGLKMLAGLCDGAAAIDDVGFNKMDTRFGKELARLPSLSQRQAAWGLKAVRKYRRQLGGESFLEGLPATKKSKVNK